jgi:hypothetical protein
MRVMLFHKSYDAANLDGPPSPELVEAFAAMDRFTEELVQAGVFVAAAGLKNNEQARRIIFDGQGRRAITDGPFAESKEVAVGFSIWEVKDMDEAMAWAARTPDMPGMKGELQILPFYEAEDLAAFMSPEELAAGKRDGERGKLGVA